MVFLQDLFLFQLPINILYDYRSESTCGSEGFENQILIDKGQIKFSRDSSPKGDGSLPLLGGFALTAFTRLKERKLRGALSANTHMVFCALRVEQNNNSDEVFVLEFVEKTIILVMLKAKPEASRPFYMMT